MRIIALSAERGVGKTTLAEALCREMRAPHIRVSYWLESVLRNAGEKVTADALRELGASKATDPRTLVRDAMEFFKWERGLPAVFDSIRHFDVLEALRCFTTPQPVLHVALQLDDFARIDRLERRGDRDAVLSGAGHSTEEQVPALIGDADVRLPADLPLAEQVAAVLRRAN